MTILDKCMAIQVDAAEFKTAIRNTPENIQKLADLLVQKFGERALKVNTTVISRGGLMPSGDRRVPLAVILKTKPGGSLTVWIDRNDPEQANIVWSGVITSSLLDGSDIEF